MFHTFNYLTKFFFSFFPVYLNTHLTPHMKPVLLHTLIHKNTYSAYLLETTFKAFLCMKNEITLKDSKRNKQKQNKNEHLSNIFYTHKIFCIT